jgi:putative membrane protein
MMWWYGPGMNGWGVTFMTIGTILFLALIIFGVIAFVRVLRTTGDRPAQERRPAPKDLLAERFARGEITEQEYRQGLDTLRSVRRPVIKS